MQFRKEIAMKLSDDKTVTVETLADIKIAIKEFLSSEEASPEVSTEIQSDGKTYKVTAPTACSYSDLLMEGFNMVKKRLDAINKPREVELGIEPINVDGHMWLDDLISRRLGGVRDGLSIKWDLKEGTFRFDPFTHKLTKCA
jgi:hypothetical protein